MRSSLYLVAAAASALAAIKDVFWDITYVDNVNPDGMFERRAIGVNGTWP
jgi:iron transport multicopper oxidase